MSHRFRENLLKLWDVPRQVKPKNLNITEKQCPNQVNLQKTSSTLSCPFYFNDWIKQILFNNMLKTLC